MQLTHDLATLGIQGREQGSGAVPDMKRFDELAGIIAKEVRVKDAVLDGEIVALDDSGMPAFYDLMKENAGRFILPLMCHG